MFPDRLLPEAPWKAVSHCFVVRACSLLCLTGFWLSPSANAQSSAELVSGSIKVGRYQFPVQLPEGFSVELLTHELEVPRILHFAGTRLFAGSRSGNVYWLDPPYKQSNVLVHLADYPHSVVVDNDQIFIAQTGGIYSAAYLAEDQTVAVDDLALLVELPGGQGHNSRTMKQGPDGKLYVSLGITGNCSNEFLDTSYPQNDRRGGIYVIEQHDASVQLEPYASGLRNPVGLDWHPETGQLYTSNNGPDHQGYEYPREYFSKVDSGSFHGMPWYQYKNNELTRDTCIDSDPPLGAELVVKPVATFPARIAPMDVAFIHSGLPGSQFEHDALVALHGSWATSDGGGSGDPASRRDPKIVRVEFDEGKVVAVHDFMTGFQLPDGQRWARPMGVVQGPDGHIYFSSDDGIQGIYRIRYDQ